jgi:hypothetical protein
VDHVSIDGHNEPDACVKTPGDDVHEPVIDSDIDIPEGLEAKQFSARASVRWLTVGRKKSA